MLRTYFMHIETKILLKSWVSLYSNLINEQLIISPHQRDFHRWFPCHRPQTGPLQVPKLLHSAQTYFDSFCTFALTLFPHVSHQISTRISICPKSYRKVDISLRGRNARLEVSKGQLKAWMYVRLQLESISREGGMKSTNKDLRWFQSDKAWIYDQSWNPFHKVKNLLPFPCLIFNSCQDQET